jgi:hypothetical protein
VTNTTEDLKTYNIPKVTIMEGILNLVTIKPFVNPIRQQIPKVKIKAASGIWITFHRLQSSAGARK